MNILIHVKGRTLYVRNLFLKNIHASKLHVSERISLSFCARLFAVLTEQQFSIVY